MMVSQVGKSVGRSLVDCSREIGHMADRIVGDWGQGNRNSEVVDCKDQTCRFRSYLFSITTMILMDIASLYDKGQERTCTKLRKTRELLLRMITPRLWGLIR